MSKSCGHDLTEILDARERADGSGAVLASRVEACRMCGQRRAVTERSEEVSAGPWKPFRFSVSPDPRLDRESAL